MTPLFILLGKLIIWFSKLSNLGSGSTWPGHIAIENDKNFIKKLSEKNNNLKLIFIAGTNGKTTTSKLLQIILKHSGKKVFHNESGANLLNGIASSLIEHSDLLGKINYDFAIFEVDENSLPLVLDNLKPEALIILNLFRDQLDRYGEVNSIASKWRKSLEKVKIPSLILNADDPMIAYLGNNRTKYFGAIGKNSSIEHASDSSYCPNCGNKLQYRNRTFSHLGDWSCRECGLKRPKIDIEEFKTYPLPGLYNKYNVNAAVLTAKSLGVNIQATYKALEKFKPAFGRQELIEYKNKKIQIFLSKNPTSLNQSLKTIDELGAKSVLLVLNDRIPDGRDVSWIWDVDFEKYIKNFSFLSTAGDRVYDMALRIKYANGPSEIKTFEVLKDAISHSLEELKEKETLYILPTYSAMLDLRKILTGKTIL